MGIGRNSNLNLEESSTAATKGIFISSQTAACHVLLRNRCTLHQRIYADGVAAGFECIV